jgi:hypothetical protein
MPHLRRFQSPDATWTGLADHATLAMRVEVALIGRCSIRQEDTQLRIETPMGGWRTLVSAN